MCKKEDDKVGEPLVFTIRILNDSEMNLKKISFLI